MLSGAREAAEIFKDMATGIKYIDSHTEGEPTRVIISGGPDLGRGTLVERRHIFADRFDDFRSSVVLEPRGSDAVVGALLCEPTDQSCVAGVIFFNNHGYLGMCGHGMIGLAVTLAYMGKISIGLHRIETPVGVVEVDLVDTNEAIIRNVASYRYRQGVEVTVPEFGRMTGDIAWGGNWFFLVGHSPYPLNLTHVRELSWAAGLVMGALREQGITGRDGAEVDHIEFFGPPQAESGHSRNFVYCPGGAYDRSPCGTGTSAKLACLAADGKLQPGEIWVQESIIGSSFQASYEWGGDAQILPTVRGRAYICAEGTQIRQDADPYKNGIL